MTHWRPKTWTRHPPPPQGCALEGTRPQRRPQRRLGRRLEEVGQAVGGGYCRLQMPLRLALAVRGTVAGHRLGALEGGYPPPPFPAAHGAALSPDRPPQIVGYGSQLHRQLEYTSNAKTTLRDLQPSTDHRQSMWPDWGRHAAGGPVLELVNEHPPSVLVSRTTIKAEHEGDKFVRCGSESFWRVGSDVELVSLREALDLVDDHDDEEEEGGEGEEEEEEDRDGPSAAAGQARAADADSSGEDDKDSDSGHGYMDVFAKKTSEGEQYLPKRFLLGVHVRARACVYANSATTSSLPRFAPPTERAELVESVRRVAWGLPVTCECISDTQTNDVPGVAVVVFVRSWGASCFGMSSGGGLHSLNRRP